MSQKSNLISVIIPVYNSRQYISGCIDSVLAQSFQNLELILVDDVSTDGSGEICDKYAGLYSNVKVIHHKANRGLSASREDGLLVAHGNYVCFMDHDDYISPFMLEVMEKHLLGQDIVVISGRNATEEEMSRIEQIEKKTPGNYEIDHFNGEEATKRILQQEGNDVICATWGKLYRKDFIIEVLEELEPCKKELPWVYLEDVMFLPICVSQAASVCFCKTVCYYHRICKENLSAQAVPKQYHYDCILAGAKVLTYFLRQGQQELYDLYLPSYLLNLESLWYRISLFEGDVEKKKKYQQIIDERHTAFYKHEIKRKVSYAQYVSIKLFQSKRGLWKFLLGNLYFKKKYRSN